MADEQKKLDKKGDDSEKKNESSNKKKRRRKPRSDIDATKKVTGRPLADFKNTLQGEVKQNADINKTKNQNNESLNASKKKKRRGKKKPKSLDSSAGQANDQVKPTESTENKKAKSLSFSDSKDAKSPEVVYQYTQPEQSGSEDSIQVFPLSDDSSSGKSIKEEDKKVTDASALEPEDVSKDDRGEESEQSEDQKIGLDSDVEPESEFEKNEESKDKRVQSKAPQLGPDDIQVAPHGANLNLQQEKFSGEENELDEAFSGGEESDDTGRNDEQGDWMDLMKRRHESDQQSISTEDPKEFEGKDAVKENPEVNVASQDAEAADLRVDEKPKEFDEKDSDAKSKVKFEGPVEEEKYPSDINFIGEKNSILDILGRARNTILKVIGSVFNLKIIFVLLFIVVLAGGAYLLFSSNILGGFNKWFGGGSADKEVTVSDEDLYRENGFMGANIFGENTGSVKDLIPVQVRISDFFGRLQEPREQGETGISAATYFGELMDQREIVNMFVDYVNTLERIQNFYQVDVYELLDKTTNREEALNNYLSDLRQALDEGKTSLSAIQLNKDDLSESYSSLSPDKQQFEDDFFVSLKNLEAQKSDVMLKSFVDASQKQVALKARVAALDRLLEYYESALAKVELRISAIEKNMEALSRGIRVVDVPGAGIDLIIREE